MIGNSLPTSVSTFASHTSPNTDQSLQKSFNLSSPDKIEFKKNSCPFENKKYATALPNESQKSVVTVLCSEIANFLNPQNGSRL